MSKIRSVSVLKGIVCRAVKLACLWLGVTTLLACSNQNVRTPVVAKPAPQLVVDSPAKSEVTTYSLPSPPEQLKAPDVEAERPKVHKPKPIQPAVLALMTQAEQSRSQGELGTAAVTLERALRIQPRSAELWCRLAKIRLRQKKYSLAENLAKKSNSLASGLAAIMSRNWVIIQAVKSQQGDDAAAARAKKKAVYYKELESS